MLNKFLVYFFLLRLLQGKTIPIGQTVNDDNSPVGFSYIYGASNKSVADVASDIYGGPISVKQVERFRAFQESLFTSDEFTAHDMRRIGYFFFGEIKPSRSKRG